jgi:hypothetical protein
MTSFLSLWGWLALQALAGAILVLTAWPGVATAQTPARRCVWPASQSSCSSWLITEAGVYVRFTDLQPSDERVLFDYAVGWMHNTGRQRALGAELFGDATSQHITLGSPMLTMRATYADKIAATARLDVLRLQCGMYCDPAPANPNATSTRFYLGAEVGSQPGVIGMALSAAAAVLVIIAYGHGNT